MKTMKEISTINSRGRCVPQWGQLAILAIALWGVAGSGCSCPDVACSDGLLITLSGEVDTDTDASSEGYTLEWREPGGIHELVSIASWGWSGPAWRLEEDTLSHKVDAIDLRLSQNGVVLVELLDEPLSWSSFECVNSLCSDTQYKAEDVDIPLY